MFSWVLGNQKPTDCQTLGNITAQLEIHNGLLLIT